MKLRILSTAHERPSNRREPTTLLGVGRTASPTGAILRGTAGNFPNGPGKRIQPGSCLAEHSWKRVLRP